MERAGPNDFSLRGAALALGCDPAALIYHFGSREGLERAVADRLHARISRLNARLPWRVRLEGMSRQYRAVAQAYPRTFPLLLKYWTTGPRDLALADDCYLALRDAGVADRDVPALEFGLYAALLGLCASEAGGLIGRPSAATLKEIRAEDDLIATRALLPEIRAISAARVFEAALTVLLDGVEAMVTRSARGPRPRPARGGKPRAR